MFRVVTYNIRAGVGVDGIMSIRRIGETLATLSPDIVCLQEVAQHTVGGWLPNQPKYLGTRLGMESAFQRLRTIGPGGFGNCIVAKSGTLHCRFHRLPGDGEPRGVLEMLTRIDGQEVVILNAHLSTDEKERVSQSEGVRKIAQQISTPKALCGDFNDITGSQTIANLLDDIALRDCALEAGKSQLPTFGCSGNKRIDYIFADLRFGVKSYDVPITDASDHYPVVVDLDWD